MKKAVLAIFAVVLIAGCTATNVDSFIKAAPIINSFLSQYPNAKFATTFVPQGAISAQIEELRKECGKDFPIGSYYKTILTDDLSGSKATLWMDSTDYTVTCAIGEIGGKKVPLSAEPSAGTPATPPPTYETEIVTTTFEATTSTTTPGASTTTTSPNETTTTILQGPNNPAVEFIRTNSRNDGGLVGITQIICQDGKISNGKCATTQLDISNAKSIIIKGKIKVIYNTLEGSGWWSDYYNGEGEYPARFYLFYSNDGTKEDGRWTWGFLPKKNVNTLKNYDIVVKGKWYDFTSENIVTYLNSLSKKPKYIDRILIAGNGWDYTSRMDDIRLLVDGVEYPFVNPDFSEKLSGWMIEHGSNVNDKYSVNIVDDDNPAGTTTTTAPAATTTTALAKHRFEGSDGTWCEDSDGNGGYYSFGTCTDNTGTYSDFCDGSTVRDYYCQQTFAPSYTTVKCAHGGLVCSSLQNGLTKCSNGACVNPSVTTTAQATTTSTSDTTTSSATSTSSSTTTTPQNLPDLEPTSYIKPRFTEKKYQGGILVGYMFSSYFNYSITNKGSADAGPFYVNVSIYNSTPSLSPPRVEWWNISYRLNGLAAGNTIYLSFNATKIPFSFFDGTSQGIEYYNYTPIVGQTYNTNVIVDPLNEVSENNETNNMKTTAFDSSLRISGPLDKVKRIMELVFYTSSSSPMG